MAVPNSPRFSSAPLASQPSLFRIQARTAKQLAKNAVERLLGRNDIDMVEEKKKTEPQKTKTRGRERKGYHTPSKKELIIIYYTHSSPFFRAAAHTMTVFPFPFGSMRLVAFNETRCPGRPSFRAG